MFKKLKFIGLLCLLLIFTFPTVAQNHPVNPYQQKVWDFERQLNQKTFSVSKDVEGSLNEIQTPALDSVGKWKVNFSPSSLTASHVEVWLASVDFTDGYWVMYYHELTADELNQFNKNKTVQSCQIVTGGDYWLTVFIDFTNGESTAAQELFTVADDASHTSLTEKITQIVNECRASTPWQTAVNLHDWLTHNLYYDDTYEYYGADGILRGYGVCDTYSKAYLMLCREAGIPVGRVLGYVRSSGENHAWNAIQLNDNWYHVDATWDDPSIEDEDPVPFSGYETHDYFCLNDDTISFDHIIDERDENVGSCTLMDMQYYIYTGEWETWGLNGVSVKIKDAIVYQLENVTDEYTIGNDAYLCYPSGMCFYNYGIYNKILAYALAHTTLTLSDGEIVSPIVKESPIRISIVRDTIILPVNLKEVAANSFNNTGIKIVYIPNGCTAIREKAFANSTVKTVHIPDTVNSIADDAFSGCNNVVFVTTNSYAISYASEHDISVREK